MKKNVTVYRSCSCLLAKSQETDAGNGPGGRNIVTELFKNLLVESDLLCRMFVTRVPQCILSN
jgi:hypothetical protein